MNEHIDGNKCGDEKPANDQQNNAKWHDPESPLKNREPENENTCAQTHQRKEECYWRTQNTIGVVNSIIALIAVVGAIVSAFLASEAFNEARRQADAAFSDQRPWLRVTLNFGGLKFAENGDASIFYEVHVKNIGKSPAQNVRESITARVMQEKSAFNTIDEQRRQCKLFTHASDVSKTDEPAITPQGIISYMPGAIVFPNEEANGVIRAGGQGSVTLSKESFVDAWPAPDRLSFQIIGCYNYGLPSGGHGQTGFAYWLVRNLGNGLDGGFAPIVGTVPAETVHFYPDPFTGGYIR